jgi:GNAT superfamily N-acetyltransferase
MEHEHGALKEESGLLWTWWRGDVLPRLQPLSNLTVGISTDVTLIAHLMASPIEYVLQRVQDNHRPYVAYVDAVPVAVGWSATGQAEFAEGRVYFRVPANNRYFYFFVTLPQWRGCGIYTHLLQAMLRIESVENERFWILHEIGNIASERGIAKAGFHLISKVCILRDESVCFMPLDEEIERARAGASVFGLPLVGNLTEGVSQ